MPDADEKRERGERLLGLVGKLRSVTLRIVQDTSGKAPVMEHMKGALYDEWDQAFIEILRELVRVMRERPSQPHR